MDVPLQDVIDLLRKEWYRLNNMDSPLDMRELGIHIGRKSQLILIINMLEREYGKI